MANANALDLEKEQARQRLRNERRQQTAATVINAKTDVLSESPLKKPQSHAATVAQGVFPRDLVQQGLIEPVQTLPNTGLYDPSLFMANPQDGRQVRRHVRELAGSMQRIGQTDPAQARFVTDEDRRLWSKQFPKDDATIQYVLLDGRQRWLALPDAGLDKLLATIVYPEQGESETDYRRRCLRLATIRMMTSQSYDIFDKVAQVHIWMNEYRLKELPAKSKLVETFDISATEAQRIRTVARLDPGVEKEIRKLDVKPSDEVIAIIAGFPATDQRAAFERFGTLPRKAARELLKQEQTPAQPAAPVSGRPANFVLRPRDAELNITGVYTNLSPQQWKEKGGTSEFIRQLEQLIRTQRHQENLADSLD